MEKHFIDIFVPCKKLRKLYYLSAALLALLWFLNLNNLHIPSLTKELETWFLDKLLLTMIVLLILYSFSTYYLSYAANSSRTKINIKNYEFKDGIYFHKETGKRYCQPCLLKGIASELTDYSLAPACQNCGKVVGILTPT
jgi:hypothetical protein